jgi:hypothetical protein
MLSEAKDLNRSLHAITILRAVILRLPDKGSRRTST